MERGSFSVVLNAKRYHKRLMEVNSMISKVLDVAQVDFMLVSSVFKKYSSFATSSIPDKDARLIALSVKELQYMDTFSQKLNHIVELNQCIIKATSGKTNHSGKETDHVGFMFKLNYLQATVAADELIISIKGLRKNLHALHDHIMDTTKLNIDEGDYFRHLKEVKERLGRIISPLYEMQLERSSDMSVPMASIESEMKKIAQPYTMDSERFVLQWLLEYPQTSAEELLQQYQRQEYGLAEKDIELF